MATKALVLIDIQREYFPGGGLELVAPEPAAAAAATALAAARAQGLLVVHVRHENAGPEAPRFRAGSAGAEIHPAVAPFEGEKIVTKRKVDSFAGTGLEAFLRARGIEEIAVGGMMIHMCVDSFLRAATAMDFHCSLLVDATATRDLEWGGRVVVSPDVTAALCAAFSFFGVRILEAGAWARELQA
jgi:nicotinamidase-related amidase